MSFSKIFPSGCLNSRNPCKIRAFGKKGVVFQKYFRQGDTTLAILLKPDSKEGSQEPKEGSQEPKEGSQDPKKVNPDPKKVIRTLRR